MLAGCDWGRILRVYRLQGSLCMLDSSLLTSNCGQLHYSFRASLLESRLRATGGHQRARRSMLTRV